MSFYRDYNDKIVFDYWNNRSLPVFNTIGIERVSRAGGAEVTGVDLSKAIATEQLNEIKLAAAEYQALVFRNQKINPDQHKDFGRHFGTLHQHANAAKRFKGGDPDILTWRTGKTSRHTAGEVWHNDVSCDETPISTSILRVTKLPDGGGGDTAFVNTHLAYESLSDPLKRFIEDLDATHSGLEGWTNGYGEEPDPGQKFAESNHPVVIKHPVTGRKHLFVSRAFTTLIPALTRVESASILDLLNRHIETNQAFQYRVRWEPDTVLLWDNYGTQHLAIWDYYPFERWGERVSAVNGIKPSNAQ